jgi:hypothetical protein
MSVFHYGITILAKDVADFTFNQSIRPGESGPPKIKWKK